ncbi:oligosaccharide flippase family protein [Candidatus Woesebacteria bacterium]|nr:oligosaccharide flippase family protein [Candidatus Woesebacteria bacterium]
MEHDHQKNIKKNSIVSLLSLFFQSGYSAVLGLIANLVLTIVLPPATFGVYIITLSIISFLNYFSDIGLAASLVQKKEVTDEDIYTTFTVQQILIISLIAIGFLLTNIIKDFYKLPGEAVYLYWALLISFFFSSLKTIPSILLERKVNFQKIVLVQIVENTLFYIAVSLFALAGFGLMSFTYSVLIRAIVGVFLMYSISFWSPRFYISRKSLKELLSFGIPFQTNTLLALVKDDLITLFLGRILGLTALGYIGWAKRWAEAPIRMIMDNISRILFPVFARFQDDNEKISGLIQKILRYQTLILAPLYIGAVLLMDRIVEVIPKYNKWEPALPIFYLICISAFLTSFSTPFINLFNALGKVKISFKFMIYWTVMTWLLVPVLSNRFGMLGFPIALVFLSLTFIAVMHVARKYVQFHFWSSIAAPFTASMIMGVIVFLVKSVYPSYPGLILAIISGGLVYLAMLYVVFKINLIEELKSMFKYE